MSSLVIADPCAGEPSCLVAPAEFVRLRYFFAQRLGVVDLADEQAYVVGKQRFHNLRAHGVGVLCGLDAERYVFAQGSAGSTPTTLLRVRRGAALDPCGREIVVGWDQCIDVAAWFAQHPSAHPTPVGELPPPSSIRLWVALCYRECPSDPAPAPRDPCGCDAGGCEFARIREGFELKLLTDVEEQLLVATSAPANGHVVAAEEVLNGSIEAAFGSMVAQIAGASCPDPPGDPCLLLASFQALLDPTGEHVVDLSAPDNTIPERLSLLSTAVLQRELLRALVAATDAELLGAGPRYGAVTLANAGAGDPATLSIDLVTHAADLSRDPFAAPSPQLTVHVFRYHDDTGEWEATAPDTSAFAATPAPRIELTWPPGGLVNGGRYRVLLEGDRAQPPVDTRMRPLTPLTWARHFHLTINGAGQLVLADTLF
jgi:hypothetical protein